ncbi:MAG: hypothetical protein JST_000027 [Candidatus Parcubacteria bacterium]|jgi:hypothetical protein
MKKEKEEKLLQILFEIFVENLIQDRELIDCRGTFNSNRLKSIAKKIGIPNTENLYMAISLCCSRISETPVSRKMAPGEEKKIWLAAVKTVIKGDSRAALSCYQENARQLRSEIKTKGLIISQKEFNEIIRPIYLEAAEEVLV